MSNVNEPYVALTEEQLKSYHLGHQAGVAHHKQATAHIRLKNLKLLVKLTQLEKQKPIAKLVVNAYSDSGIGIEFLIDKPEESLCVGQFVYASPKALEPLTDEEIEQIRLDLCNFHLLGRLASNAIARAIEKHRGIGDQPT